MHPILFLALKDMSQHRKEVFMVIFAIIIGVTSTICSIGFNNGMHDAFVGTVVNVQTGHIKILPETGEYFIKNSNSVVSRIESLSGVLGVSPRIEAGGFLISRTGYQGVMIIGVDPCKEEETTTLVKSIKDGEFLDENDEYEIVLGAVLADGLGVEVGDKILLRGRLKKPLTFNIKGVVSSGSFEYDGYAGFITYKMAKKIYNISDASEILIRLEDRRKSEEMRTIVQKESTSTNVKTWEELSEGMASMIVTFGIISGITSFVSVVVAAVAIGLIIYTSVKNKTREIGILKAIGSSNFTVLMVFLMEGVLMASVGIIFGTLIGILIVNHLHSNPIIITPRDVVLEITPWILPETVLWINGMMLITCVIGGLYPAIIASRTNIIRAIWGG